MVNNRSRSNARNIVYEDYQEDLIIVEDHLKKAKDTDTRLALLKLTMILKQAKANV